MGMYSGITTSELDTLAAETCAYMNIVHPSYSFLAAKIAVNNLHKSTSDDYKVVADQLRSQIDVSGRPAPLLAQDVYDVMMANIDEINKKIDYTRDYQYDYFGYKTLERGYLMQVDKKIVERPQHLIMRVAFGIHKADVKAAFETYELMSLLWFTHATPTLFNAGTNHP